MANILAFATLLIWLYLVLGRGWFWLGSERDDAKPTTTHVSWPRVTVVIPARDERQGIGECITSLLRQDYPGDWSIILVDDNSSDGTAEVARQAAAALGQTDRLTIMSGRALPAGWTGKLWALKQGIEAAEAAPTPSTFLLLSDADIVYTPDTIAGLVARSTSDGLVLNSLMAKLRCESFAERSHVPAFIFFFQMLYPFTWVNRADDATAAAAGGCMLVHAQALRRAGGIESIRNALIDDCALARRLKSQGPIRLNLTERARSIRAYSDYAEISRMVTRSAYAQLNYSPLLLLGTTIGMALTYVAPLDLALFGHGTARALGIFTWALMAMTFQPTLRFYRLSPLWGLALPAIAFSYMLLTLYSALQFYQGAGGLWKGRIQAARS